jgi:hypothetical protein
MACPPDSPISDHGKISTYATGEQAAIAQALAAVDGAAAMAAFDATNCPSSCPFASPFNITYTVTAKGAALSLMLNILTLGLSAWFGDGAIYKGWAEFDWSATARCVDGQDSVFISVARQNPNPHEGSGY